jgi:hypothetical protein
MGTYTVAGVTVVLMKLEQSARRDSTEGGLLVAVTPLMQLLAWHARLSSSKTAACARPRRATALTSRLAYIVDGKRWRKAVLRSTGSEVGEVQLIL